jgi:asparagine synthase (glutamine-hydrolysing)
MSCFRENELEQLGVGDVLTGTAPEPVASVESMDDVLRFDVEDYMPADILTKIDRASMAHGLELRAPFLDVDFASFCISLPYRLKVSTREDKLILRQAFAAQWPAILRRRGKQGFGAPLQQWFHDPTFRELEQRCLQDPAAPIYGLLSYVGTKQILRAGNLMQRWTLLVLATWLMWIKVGNNK